MPSPVPGADEVVDHLNDNHADTVLFVSRHALANAELVDAWFVDVDTAGLNLRVADPTGQHAARIDFRAPVTDTPQLQQALFGMLEGARAAQPDVPLTSMERERQSLDDLRTRVIEVVATSDVGAGLRQVTFRGFDDLQPLGPDDFHLLIRPRPGLQHQLGELDFRDFRDLPDDQTPHWAYYTQRRHRPDSGEMDMWFVLHDDDNADRGGDERGGDGCDGDGSLAHWATTALPGDRLAAWGPRELFAPPAGTRQLLLVGDETGLAAIAAILEAPRTATATVIAVSDDGHPVVHLPAGPDDEVHWVSRGGAPRGTTTTLLDALRTTRPAQDGLYAYGAGETRQMAALRRHLRHECGLPGPAVNMVGYWRRSA